MPPRLTSKVTVKQGIIDLIDSLPRKMLDGAFNRMVRRIDKPIRASIIKKLPDGQESGTRAKQSEKTRQRFPHEIQLKKNVRRKTIHDTMGTLIIVGVSSKAGHVNFDHGKKAKKGVGREHKLWWVDGVREVWHVPKYRKQVVDISLQTKLEFEGPINQIIKEEVKRELRAFRGNSRIRKQG